MPLFPTATIETEHEITPTPFVTSTPINTVVLTPTPVYTITSIALLRECRIPSEGAAGFHPCSGFEFSPDGRFVGFFFGPDLCGRGILIFDTQTATTIYRYGPGGGFGFKFLENGKILLTTGHCEGGEVELFDPITRQLFRLGNLGVGGWNAVRTAIAVEAGLHIGIRRAIWGYNVEKDFLFLSQPETWDQVDHHLLWTPEGSHILFLHRPVSYTWRSGIYTFPEAQSIVRVDATTGEQQVLVSDSRYDYHFCAGWFNRCDQWYGDWIQVRRFPFEPQDIVEEDFYDNLPAATCVLEGRNCREPLELFALNWRTGELIPWDEALPSTFAPIPAQPDTTGVFIP